MTERSVTHGTFALEHVYAAPPARVFDAWADPAVKTRWFTGALDPAADPMRMDFRVGGTERAVGRTDDGSVIVYEGLFRDIVPAERIVVANWIDVDGQRISVSQFTAEFRAVGNGTRLVVTEQGAYLDGHDSPASRASGIRAQLDALAVELEGNTTDTGLGMSSDQAQADERQIRALLQARLGALCAKDASQFVAAYDTSIVKFDLAPPLRERGSAVLDPAGLQWWLSTWDGELTVDLADLSITVGGDVAFCHCLEHIQGTRSDGEDQNMWTRSTLGLRKIDDAWKITHEHNSAPFYMDGSGRPALDLLP